MFPAATSMGVGLGTGLGTIRSEVGVGVDVDELPPPPESIFPRVSSLSLTHFLFDNARLSDANRITKLVILGKFERRVVL